MLPQLPHTSMLCVIGGSVFAGPGYSSGGGMSDLYRDAWVYWLS